MELKYGLRMLGTALQSKGDVKDRWDLNRWEKRVFQTWENGVSRSIL